MSSLTEQEMCDLYIRVKFSVEVCKFNKKTQKLTSRYESDRVLIGCELRSIKSPFCIHLSSLAVSDWFNNAACDMTGDYKTSPTSYRISLVHKTWILHFYIDG